MVLRLVVLLGVLLGAVRCASGLGGADGGQDPCATLVARVCGAPDAGPSCEGTAACDSARLTATYEPARCPEHLANASYEDCATARAAPPGSGGAQNAALDLPDDCDTLRAKVCGPDDNRWCAGSEACAAAEDVVQVGDVSACRQALGDDTSFPRCQPS
ncbi:MAG: hypothetical protein HY904_18685 [Deltaproteobacteria bacterium]|nr:hypothetical protein [Deltaproteobacteria bacterium]